MKNDKPYFKEHVHHNSAVNKDEYNNISQTVPDRDVVTKECSRCDYYEITHVDEPSRVGRV